MIPIENGDIFDSKYKLICHQVNTLGIMGAGLAKRIKTTYPEVYESYSTYVRNSSGVILGDALHVITHNKDKCIFNLFAQDRISGAYPRTNYEALSSSFEKMVETKLGDEFGLQIAIPFGIGCGLAGGDWSVVVGIVENVFRKSKYDAVFVKFT